MADDHTDLVLEALHALGQSVGAQDPKVKSSINACITEYLERRHAADAAQPGSQQKADFKRQQEALAKGLPGTAKGVLATIDAFRSGNAAEGLAAVMDTCSSLFTMIGGLVGATGVPLIGALFSVLSELIRFSSKKSESTRDQFEKMVRALQAEQTFQDIRAAQDAIKRFSTAIADAIRKTDAAGDVATVRKVVASLNGIEGDVISRITRVCRWLETPGNQAQPLWPDVLGALVRTYADRTIGASAVYDTLALLHEKLKSAPEAEKPKIELELSKLLSTVHAFLIEVHADYPRQLQFLEGIKPAARNRGTLWSLHDQIRFDRPPMSGSMLWARDGLITENAWTQLRDTDCRAMAVTRTRPFDEPSAHPYLAVVAQDPAEPRDPGPFRSGGRVYIRYGQWPLAGATGWQELAAFNGCRDVQVGSRPLVPEGKDAVDRMYFVVVPPDNTAVKEFLENPANGKIEEIASLTYIVPQYHALAAHPVLHPRPADVFADDGRLIYSIWSAGVGMNIGCHRYAKQDGKSAEFGTFLPPWDTFGGMAVDGTYLWLYRESDIACVAHQDAAHGKPGLPMPWMTYRIPNDIGGYDPSKKQRAEYQDDQYFGLLHLSACDDGTLTAVFHVQEHGRYHPELFTLTPRIDRQKKTLTIEGEKRDDRGNAVKTNGWVRCSGSDPMLIQAHKQPIFCWTLMEGVADCLQKTMNEDAAKQPSR